MARPADPVLVTRKVAGKPAPPVAAAPLTLASVQRLRAMYGFSAVYVGLGLALVIAAFAAGLLGPWKVQPRPVTVTRTVAPATGAALVHAWGQPDRVIPGAQVSQGLNGATCALYQSRHALVCY